MDIPGQSKNNQPFQSGMTLEQYLRNIQFQQETVPTADTHNPHSEIQELQENLYKTANISTNKHPNQKLLTFSIKEIQQQNFQDSLDQLRESSNVASTNFQKIAKQQFQSSIPIREMRNKQRKSISPFPQKLQTHQQKFSPQKTFTKTFYGNQKLQYKNKSVGKAPKIASTLYGNKFGQGHKEKMKKLQSEREKKMWKKKINEVDMIESIGGNLGEGLKHLDMRVQGFKDRLHTKTKF